MAFQFLLLMFFLFCSLHAEDPYKKLRELFNFNKYEDRIFSIQDIKNPDVLIYSIGKSFGGRNIWCIEKRSRYYGTEKEDKRILILGTSHPIEWTAVEVPMRLAEYFAQAKMDEIEHYATFYIIPIFNPDGFDYMRVIPVFYESNRKNRYFNPEEKNPGIYKRGVDLNRNFSYMWKFLIADETSDYYQGPYPFSEPETIALRDFVMENKIDFVVSMHTPGKLVQYPWSYTREPLKDSELIEISRRIASIIGNGYFTLQDAVNYEKPGSEIDWFYGEMRIKAIRIEIGKDLIDRRLGDYEGIKKAIIWLSDCYLKNDSIVE